MMREESMLKQQQGAAVTTMLVTSAVCILPSITAGTLASYAAITMTKYTDPDNESGIHMSTDQMSWFAAFTTSSQLVGNLLSTYLTERFGRRSCILGSALMIVLGSLAMLLSLNYAMILAGGITCSVFTGLMFPASYLLLSEVSLIRYRGGLGCANSMALNVGYLYGILVGPLVPLVYTPLVMMTPCALFILLSFLLVESPLWYVRMDRKEEARKVLISLRGDHYDIEPEMKELEHLVSQSKAAKLNIFEVVRDRSFVLPLLLLCAKFTGQVLSGVDTVSIYAFSIFKKYNIGIGEQGAAALFQVALTAGYLISIMIMSRVNRRPQFISSILVMSACMLTLGIVNFPAFMELPYMLDMNKYLSLPCILMLGFVYGLGVGPVPFSLTGEIFPQEYKSFGCSFCIAVRYVVQFISLRVFPIMEEALGMSGVYWCFCASTAFFGILAFFSLPETRNKSLTQITNLFKKGEHVKSHTLHEGA